MRTPILTVITVLALAFILPSGLTAQQRTSYLVVELGTLGGTASGASAINNRGWVMGAANLPGDMTEHATLWIYGKTHDLGTLGGPNSAVPWPAVKNVRGVLRASRCAAQRSVQSLSQLSVSGL